MRKRDEENQSKRARRNVEPSKTCISERGGPCKERPKADRFRKCRDFCTNAMGTPEVPRHVMKNWDATYNIVMKDGDVGCQPYFSPPTNPIMAARITGRLHEGQATFQDNVTNAMKHQIMSTYEDDRSQNDETLMDGPKVLTHDDIERMRILNAPSVDSAYRNYMTRSKESLDETKQRNISAENISVLTRDVNLKKKRLSDPADRKKDFIFLSKMVTTYDEEITRNIEQVWSAIGPLIMELDLQEKRKALKNISKALKESKIIQLGERKRLLEEKQGELTNFVKEKSTELDKKYNDILSATKASNEKARAYTTENLFKSYEAWCNYEIEWAKAESTEKYQESIRSFTHYCNIWLDIMDIIDKKTESDAAQLVERDKELVVSVQNTEKARIMKSVDILNREHEQIQGALADCLYSRDQIINTRLVLIGELEKKVDVWKNLTGDLMKQFQKYVRNALGEQGMLAQYLLSTNAMYEHFLKDSLQKEQEVKAKDLAKEMELLQRKSYPACALGDRLSQESKTTSRGSTSETDPEAQESQVPEAILEGIATGKFPERIDSYDELEYRREQEVEFVVQSFGYEETDSGDQDLAVQSELKWSSRRSTSEDEQQKSVNKVLDDECTRFDQSTMKAVHNVKNLLTNEREFMERFIALWYQ